jgi:ABC-type multidrug transport system permease subunit
MRSYRAAFALDALHGLLTLAIYFFISRFFSEPDTAALNDAPNYFAFASVGIITGAILLSGAVEVSRRLREEQLAGTLEALAAQPLTPTEMCLGLVGFPFGFALVRALLYLLIATFAMNVNLLDVSWIGLVLVLLSATAAFAALGIVAAALVLTFKRGDVITATLVTIMTVVSGSVFPISTLPGWLQPIARLLPTSVAFDGVRNAIFRGEGWALDVLKLIGFAGLGLPLAATLFGLALENAHRSGSLTAY